MRYTPNTLGVLAAMRKTRKTGKVPDHPLTPTELEIISVLWETGPANVQTVQQRLKRELAYTTVQTMLNILNRKGKVKRTLENRAYLYQATIGRRLVVHQSTSDLVDRLFGGSAENLVMSLLATKHLTPQWLARLNQLLTASERAKEANIETD
jgi:BlaI family penicillinase repressor